MDKTKLKYKQALPLDTKILIAKRRIKEWYDYYDGEVYVSFSGGKDSTVLLHLVREMYPEVEAIFCDTGLEFPEIREFVKSKDNVTWLKPKLNFKQVLDKYGFPVVSKEQSKYINEAVNTKSDKLRHLRLNGRIDKPSQGKISNKHQYLIKANFKISDKCCDIMKKNPIKAFNKISGKFSFTGIMAEDSMLRNQSYLKYGCNSFNSKRPQSRPLMTWLEKDIWEYIKTYDVFYSKIYDMGYKRTGCVFCMFGVHLEKSENRFQILYKTHPHLHKYCMEKLGLKEVLEFININPYPETEIQQELF